MGNLVIGSVAANVVYYARVPVILIKCGMAAATRRLARDGANALPSASRHTWRAILWHAAPAAELLPGGVTRTVMKAMTVPVLIAH